MSFRLGPSEFIEVEYIEVDAMNGVPVRIEHGFGRPPVGWVVIWRTASCDFVVQNPAADSSRELVLVPDGTATVRLVLL